MGKKASFGAKKGGHLEYLDQGIIPIASWM